MLAEMASEDEPRAREERQLVLMRDRLTAFRSGRLPLKRLIDDLEGLLWALELASDDWKDAFRTEWGELEIAYAVADDHRDPVPDMTDAGVASAVETLLRMVDSQLGSG
jgi:hypothetical protein